jgi:hypothetical protein
MKALVALTLLVCTLAVLFTAIPHIHAWEKANAYPYGKMCNSIFTAYVDTCR